MILLVKSEGVMNEKKKGEQNYWPVYGCAYGDSAFDR